MKAVQQTVSNELRRWIMDQAEAGCTPESVLAAMQAAGWNEDVAVAALEETLGAHPAAKELAADEVLARAAALNPDLHNDLARRAMPELRMNHSPLVLDGGDRRVAVLASLQHPRVVVLGGLLDDVECDAIMEAARPRLSRSLTVEVNTGGEEVNDDRTSQGMFFTRGENAVVQRVEARLAQLLNWPVENGEGMQVLRYGPGAEYKPHYDYFEPDAPGTPTIVKRGGQRVATVIMYLSEPVSGGATVFPDARLEVAPRRGNAVFFSYDAPDPATLTLHGGAPVFEGEKWIATKWLRERKFA